MPKAYRINPIVIAFLIPIYNPLNQSFFRLLAKIYLKMSILIIILLYGFDLGNYSYLDQRIDISSIKLLENPLIAFGMAWESYPMVIILFILFIVVYFVWSNIDKTFTILTNRPKVFNFSQSIIGSTISGFIFIFAIYCFLNCLLDVLLSTIIKSNK